MKIKADKKSKETPIKEKTPDEELISFVMSCHEAGDKYQRKFRTRWDVIEEQIRCVHPSAWATKEDWQTKIFVPQQSKTSETAQAYLDKMLVGQKRFYSITGTNDRDREEEGYLSDLYDIILDRGGFFLENDFVFNECSGNTGTSFLKVLVRPDRTGLQFIWRSAYNIRFSPDTGHRLSNSPYITDEYRKPITELIREVEDGNSIYTKETITALLEKGQEVGLSKTDQALQIVRGFDGTNYQVAQEYTNINIVEFWGSLKKTKKAEKKGDKDTYTYEDRIFTVGNGVVKMRDVPNEYGFTPIFGCRVKPRKYDYYGLGFCDNVTDMQELTNSMINLGFDSLKMCSMDIAVLDKTKIADPASIEYRPMATWLVKGNPNEAVKLTRQGISALGDIMRGLGLMDQIQQEATGVLRQIQGAPELGGGGSETLGEYQAKLAMIDNRFLKIGRFIERDYIEPMLKGIFKILFNKKFFSQAAIDKMIGYKTIDTPISSSIVNFMRPFLPARIIENVMATIGPFIGRKKISKLMFEDLSNASDMAYDFKAVGMTQFSKSIETLQKLKELLLTVVKTPQLMIMSKVDEIYKRVLQAAEIQDYQELIKSDEEIKQIMNQIYAGAQGQPQGGAPARTPGQQPVPSGAMQ